MRFLSGPKWLEEDNYQVNYIRIDDSSILNSRLDSLESMYNATAEPELDFRNSGLNRLKARSSSKVDAIFAIIPTNINQAVGKFLRLTEECQQSSSHSLSLSLSLVSFVFSSAALWRD